MKALRISRKSLRLIFETLKDEQIEMNENNNALNTRITEETQRLIDML